MIQEPVQGVMPGSKLRQDSFEQRTFKTSSAVSPVSVFARSTTAGSPQSGHDSSVSFVTALTSCGTSVVTDEGSLSLTIITSPFVRQNQKDRPDEGDRHGSDVVTTRLTPKPCGFGSAELGKPNGRDHGGLDRHGEPIRVLILLALILVAIFVGLGFAIHVLWVVAAVLFVLWLVGLLIGRGESAGSRRFYRW